MIAHRFAWVGLFAAWLFGVSHASAQEAPAAAREIMQQLDRDVREIQRQAERSVEARKLSALQQLDKLARDLEARGDAAGAAQVRQIAAALGGGRPADAPIAAGGKKCEVLWSTRWYPATLLDQKEGRFYIKYDGYGDNWNEWVGPDRIKFAGGAAPQDPQALPPPNGAIGPKPAAGKAVDVLWGGQWWPAVVRQEKEGKWLIHYDNHADSWDEWVGPERIRAK